MTKVTMHETPLPKADDTVIVPDSAGRRLSIKEPDVLQESRLIRFMGGEASANTGYMLGYVMPAAMVVAIDGDPVIFPMSQGEVDALIQRLGRHGLSAVMNHWSEKAKSQEGAAEIKK